MSFEYYNENLYGFAVNIAQQYLITIRTLIVLKTEAPSLLKPFQLSVQLKALWLYLKPH